MQIQAAQLEKRTTFIPANSCLQLHSSCYIPKSNLDSLTPFHLLYVFSQLFQGKKIKTRLKKRKYLQVSANEGSSPRDT